MEKKKYERPTIVRHTAGFGNKFGRAQKSRIKKEIDGVLVKDLIRHHGSPVFVFSEKTIRTNFRRALNTFSARYPKVQFAWSYKTNYLDAVCRIFHQEGSWAEVVSEFEYEMARRNGISGEKIIYNGPYSQSLLFIPPSRRARESTWTTMTNSTFWKGYQKILKSLLM